jgi:hypothetical protein
MTDPTRPPPPRQHTRRDRARVGAWAIGAGITLAFAMACVHLERRAEARRLDLEEALARLAALPPAPPAAGADRGPSMEPGRLDTLVAGAVRAVLGGTYGGAVARAAAGANGLDAEGATSPAGGDAADLELDRLSLSELVALLHRLEHGEPGLDVQRLDVHRARAETGAGGPLAIAIRVTRRPPESD